MRRRHILASCLLVAGLGFGGGEASAQPPAEPRSALSRAAQELGGVRVDLPVTRRADADLLTPYTTRNERSFQAERGAYVRRTAPSRPTMPARSEYASRGAVFAQSGNYYPALRAGQSPNRNMVDHRGLCVPGRRALIAR